ncbi:hypothetical protein LXA43DRAFT_1007649 [Ganoderma leucocontextum]|nr:hypothetical protein LXA43DRAFT_1007649 [Ganoderma leucocontextum]
MSPMFLFQGEREIDERAYVLYSTPQDTLFLGPLSPMSPFSPIETFNSLEQQYQELRQLACISRGFHNTVVEEIPSVAEAVEQIKKVSSYLDLYRVANQSRRDVDATGAVTDLNTVHTAYTDATNPDDAYTAYIAYAPVSAHHRRRSVSFSQVPRPSMLSNGLYRPHSASVQSFDGPGRYTLVIKIPSPFGPSFSSSTANSTRMSRSRTFVLDTPQTAKRDMLLETPRDDTCPLQQQQREARVRAALEAIGDSAPPPAPAPLIAAQTPRGPYWVRQSYRISGQGSVRRRRSSIRVPPTPLTVRRERRQGWGGEWKSGKLGAAVEELMEIKTPAPRVSRRLTNGEVPPVPMKDFIVIQ